MSNITKNLTIVIIGRLIFKLKNGVIEPVTF